MFPFLLLLLLSLILPFLAAESSPSSLALPGCQEKCGNVDIPYPFGTGDSRCYRDTGFWITCNDSFTPPKPFIQDGDIEVLELSTAGYLRTDGWMSWECYSNGLVQGGWTGSTDISRTPYIFSDTRNKFTAIGCDTEALIMGSEGRNYTGGCVMLCQDLTSVINGSCDGIGCCQQSIPKGLRKFEFTIDSFNNHSGVSDFNPCSYAFLVDVERFNFSTEYLRRRNFSDQRTFPRVLDWAIREEGCEEAGRKAETYACGENTVCFASDNGPGYRCNCSLGYQGNPYHKDGCRDVNECEGSSNPCEFSRFCNNTEGGFRCSCPSGYYGDGIKNGSGCTHSPTRANYAVIKVTLGIASGFLFLLIGGSWLFWLHKKNKLAKHREKFFHQNGGFLLQQQMSSLGAAVETTKLFTAEELKKATNNFSATQILGKGGYGTVYRGVLPDNRIVAIKRSQMVDETQIEQFINELLILSQIHHRNVVKLLGCCLETEVPLLVYEFVSNGTLFEHIHDERHVSSLSWENRLRIATETARALSYLHSAASIPIIHRDIKSSNILLDYNYTAKVADFGASRLIPLDQSQLNTLVQGTLGYLDPEYFLTSQLTDKSDVYSFGVVLVELLTGKLPLSFERSEEDRNLAMYFISSMKQKRVLEILEERVVEEASSEQLLGVADLAKRCLRVRGEERPSMKEVEMEIEGLRKLDNHPWRPENPEETEFLLGKPSKTHTDQASATSSAAIDYDSLKDQIKLSLPIGR